MSLVDDLQSGRVFGAMVRGSVPAPWSLPHLVAAGLIGITPVTPVPQSEWPATGAVAFRARFTYRWQVGDHDDPPTVLAAILGSPPEKLLLAAAWAPPAGFQIHVGDEIAIPIFFSVQQTSNS